MQSAAGIYEAALQHAPDTVDALEGLAALRFEAGDRKGAEAVLARLPEGTKETAGLAALRARMALADQAASLGDMADLERRVAENPKDHQARFDLAMAQNAAGEREKAAENLLAIVRADRNWKDDAARSQLLQLFEAWGMTDEVTLSARRRLSSLLFS
jgi:putative thioredoxin